MLGDNRYNSVQLGNSLSIKIGENIVQATVSFIGLNQRDTALSNSASLGLFVFYNIYGLQGFCIKFSDGCFR
jgi:hypothetical protein